MESTHDAFILAELSPGVTVRTENDGVLITNWRALDAALSSDSRLGRLLTASVSQLLESGLGREINSHLLIPYTTFAELPQHDIDAFDGMVPPSPFMLTLESSGALASPLSGIAIASTSVTEPSIRAAPDASSSMKERPFSLRLRPLHYSKRLTHSTPSRPSVSRGARRSSASSK